MTGKVLEKTVLNYSVWNVKYHIRKIKGKDKRKIKNWNACKIIHKKEQLIILPGIIKRRKSNWIEFNCCSLKCWVERQVANKRNSAYWNTQMTKRQRQKCEDIYSWRKETFL